MKCKVKRNTKKVTLLLSLLLLSSCNLEVTFFPYTHHISDTDTYTRIETSDYYKVGAFAQLSRCIKSNLNGNSRVVPLKSSNEQKILVLPVNFLIMT